MTEKEYYNYKLQEGKKYELFIKEQLYKQKNFNLNLFKSKLDQYNIGESLEGIEIKFDNRMKYTENVYIEFEEKTNSNNENWINSGILRNDNTHSWIIGNYNKAYIFWKIALQQIFKNKKYLKEVETKTSKGFLLNKEMIKKYKIGKLTFN
tara:strand:+ start:1530 stop:1982 length:453 start_codon:yes stop_codon:yes gene_type:complete